MAYDIIGDIHGCGPSLFTAVEALTKCVEIPSRGIPTSRSQAHAMGLAEIIHVFMAAIPPYSRLET
jgi:hypothetical protein